MRQQEKPQNMALIFRNMDELSQQIQEFSIKVKVEANV